MIYHYRNHHFFQKIEKLILILILDNKNQLNININEDEILNIFIENKRILLFLQEEHIINNKNRLISKIVTNNKLMERNYIEYFSKEMQELMNEETNENIQEIKEEYLNTGENEKQICQIIRQDSIDDFINYLTTNNVHINDYIPPSIYETNLLLLKHKNVSLIEYASFYGSMNIFNYLKMKCAIIDYQTYKFAIHSDNQIMISNFEEYIKQDIKKCLKFAHKYHSFNILEYVQKCIEQQFRPSLISLKKGTIIRHQLLGDMIVQYDGELIVEVPIGTRINYPNDKPIKMLRGWKILDEYEKLLLTIENEALLISPSSSHCFIV